MSEMPESSSGTTGSQDTAGSGKFGGSLGSQHKQSQEDQPELQPGASGSSPHQQPPPTTIRGQLGGVGGQTSPNSAPSGSGSTLQPSQPKRKSGCFGVLLAVICVGAALVSGFTAF